MNETNHPASTSDAPWSTSDHQDRTPDAPALPSSEKAGPAAVGLLKSGEQAAHDTIHRLADRAEPAVRKLGESVSAAGETLHAKADQFRETRDEWVEGARNTVRGNPLVSIAAALALGAVFARITR